VTDRLGSADAHAYVDNSLAPADRQAFEARLREDAELRRRVDLWAAQNEAIRLAYGAPARPRGPLSLGRPANENPSPRVATDLVSRRGGERSGASATRCAGLAEAPRVARPAMPARRAAWSRRLASVAFLALGLLSLSAFDGPSDPRDSLMDAGVSAYRAFGDSTSAPPDFATHDARELGRWLAPKFTPAPVVGDLEIPGWRLIGARVVSGVSSAAAFILFENGAGERAGLLVQPLDAPPEWAPASRNIGPIVLAARTEGSLGVAAVGPSIGIVAAMMRVWGPAVAGED
jgi:anti-sigma factor RsiW